MVRDANEDGTPGTVLTSTTITTDQLDTTRAGNLVYFPNPPRFQGVGFIPDSLFVGFEWVPTEDDTFAVYADSNGYGDSQNRTWEQIFIDPDWVMWSWTDPSDFSWHLDADVWTKAYVATSPTGVGDRNRIVPEGYDLSQNYPDPFNPVTTIRYRLLASTLVTLKIFDALGKEVMILVDGIQEPGARTVRLDARGLSSGFYVCRMQAGEYVASMKLVLLK